ncbi:Hypothetical protein CINCED_3A001216 [Cinara cedri]|uniref:Homologous recombination OB-fold protein OB-fold domain-containing protein n=1 Tax=Cinara cedri TaxID=506608 RepID=A0A5E4MXF5_9HEMI|nr:Hypothetical protein CINCED_3A001216 [Cinara cedri]
MNSIKMFELEDFDLDDEVFLNTQIPAVINKSPIKSSNNTDCDTFNFIEDNLFLNISNPNDELESLHSQNIESNHVSQKEQNKNESDLQSNIHTVLITEHVSEITKPVNKCVNKNLKLTFDDEFDSDDEAFFNTPEILHEPINSLKTNDSSNKRFNESKDYNENISNSVTHKSILKSPNIKNLNKSSFNNHLNTTVTSVKTTPKHSSRKFPGPAGLLSEDENIHSEDPADLESLDMSISIFESDKKEENLCTQANDSSFSSLPYQQFLSDFVSTDVDMLLNQFNVASLKQKILPFIASGRFFTDKIPFFVSVIKEINCLSPDPTVVLADKTGHVRGTIHRAVWNQFSCQLKLGAVLVLSKVGVSCQKIVKGFTMNITSDHLVAIYSFASDTGEVIVTRTTDLTNKEIVNDAKRWNISNNLVSTRITAHDEIRSRMIALNNLKLHTISLNQNSQPSNLDYQTTKNVPLQTTPVKNIFVPKAPVAHNLIKNYSCNKLFEEPPAKRIRNDEYEFKNIDNYSHNERSIIENIFEGIDEEEMFNDFCC